MATALITGAASLIGEGIAQALGSQGWDLALTDINTDGAQKVAAALPEGVGASVSAMDVTDLKQIEAVMSQVASEQGGIQALVNVAGGLRGLGIPRRPLVEIPPEEWHRIIDVNLKGTMKSICGVLPIMKAQGNGTIVSITASRGLRGGPMASHYSAAKAGIILFTQTMVLECAEYGVRINSIAPGNTEARWKTDPEGTTQPPLGRPANSTDIGNAAAWLLSDQASHVTGACIDVSGGTALH